jgi:hypothetical protein
MKNQDIFPPVSILDILLEILKFRPAVFGIE